MVRVALQAVRASATNIVTRTMRAIMLNFFIVLCVRIVTATSVLEAVGVIDTEQRTGERCCLTEGNQ